MAKPLAPLVRAFQQRFSGNDASSIAVRTELARLFPARASGKLPGEDRRDGDEMQELLDVLARCVETSDVFGAAPPAIRELATFMVFEDYVNGTGATRMQNQSLYGVDDFDELNGPEGILGAMKESGDAPAGVFCIGENVFVDTGGDLGARKPGAVYSVIGFALDSVDAPCAPTLDAFLARCQPSA